MFFFAFYCVLLHFYECQLIFSSLVVGTWPYFQYYFNEIEFLVVVSFFIELTCFYKVIVAPAYSYIKLTFKLSDKVFALIDVTVKYEFVFLFSVCHRAINKLNKNWNVVFIFWHSFFHLYLDRIILRLFWNSFWIYFQSEL